MPELSMTRVPIVTFQTAADRLQALGFTDDDIADALRVDPSTLGAHRLAHDDPGHRPPPGGWQRAVASMASRRAQELVALAEMLRGLRPSPGATERDAVEEEEG